MSDRGTRSGVAGAAGPASCSHALPSCLLQGGKSCSRLLVWVMVALCLRPKWLEARGATVNPGSCSAQPFSAVSPPGAALAGAESCRSLVLGPCGVSSSRMRGLFGSFLSLRQGCGSWGPVRDSSPTRFGGDQALSWVVLGETGLGLAVLGSFVWLPWRRSAKEEKRQLPSPCRPLAPACPCRNWCRCSGLLPGKQHFFEQHLFM